MNSKELLKLLDGKNFISGNFTKTSDEFLDVLNPSTLDKIGEIPISDNNIIINAISSAELAYKEWKKTNIRDRKKILDKLYDLIIQNIDLLAEIITLENGKPLDDAKKEVMYGANFISWFSAQISSISGHISSGISPNQKILIEYEPIGIVASITPWNFPFAMVARKIAPALASGCTVVLKPSELTPFSALALAKLCKDAGLPDGVINIITGSPDEISEIFGRDKRIRKLSFTGSTETGKILYSKSAQTLKKLSLELGGNSPFIVCQDADIEMAVNGLVAAKLRSTGQSCTSPNRIFLDSKISDEFIKLLSSKFSNLIVGDGFNPSVNIGPLINKKSVHKIEKLIENAKENGAKIVLGGKKSEYYISANGEKLNCKNEHNFFEPTILTNCNQTMDIFKTEIFGPIIACYNFESIDEVISAANNTDYGLASYVYTNNFKDANQIADSLDYGIVGINESIISNEIGAFGGRKDSGFGIEGSKLGIYEYLITKYKMLSY